MGKDTINKWIISFLSVGKRGFKSNFDLATIFLLILKRLKTGVQWRELPIEVYFEKGLIMRYEYLDVTWIGMLLLGFYLQVPQKSLNTFSIKMNDYIYYFRIFCLANKPKKIWRNY